MVGLYLNPPEQALVLSCDEKSQIQALNRTQPGLAMKRGRAGTITHDYKRHGTTTLFATLNTLDGRVISMCQPRHRHTEWLKFLRLIERKTPKRLTLRRCTWSWTTAPPPSSGRAGLLAKHPRFVMHFTPPGASWRWTSRIHEEWTRNLAASRPELGPRLEALVELMNASVPDCLVVRYEELIEGLVLPDPGDRHVLAAAIAGHADAIVTFNLRDFPTHALEPYGIEALHPDDFVLNQLELQPLKALVAIKKMRTRLRRPAQTPDELVATFERVGLPASASHLQHARGLI